MAYVGNVISSAMLSLETLFSNVWLFLAKQIHEYYELMSILYLHEMLTF